MSISDNRVHLDEGTGMDLRISLADGDLADLESLQDWLGQECELTGRVRLSGSAPRSPAVPTSR
jgi:hypothetical protein